VKRTNHNTYRNDKKRRRLKWQRRFLNSNKSFSGSRADRQCNSRYSIHARCRCI